MIRKLFTALFISFSFIVTAQDSSLATILTDTVRNAVKVDSQKTVRIYQYKNEGSIYFEKPKTFSFITDIPANAVGYTKQSFQKKNLYKVGIVAGATALLIVFDQQIVDAVQNFARRNNISAEDDFDPFFRIKIFGKPTNIGKWPRNFNTAIYNFGQGSSVVWMAAGFLIAGKLKHDNRALQTASQLIQSFIALGAGTQVMKYATGRETPFEATVSGGRWRPFPSFSKFQNEKPKYDAYPSGHLATLVSAVTIISENYPKAKWVKPIGYTLSGLLSFAMMNNGVHWAADYPLGFALGYGYGKFISHKSHTRSIPSL